MEQEPDREEEMQVRQDAALYPLGRSLRSTFPAEVDDLHPAITSLMIELSQRPYEDDARIAPAAARPPVLPPRPRLIGRMVRQLFGDRRSVSR